MKSASKRARSAARNPSFASMISQSEEKRALTRAWSPASAGRRASINATNCGTGSASASDIALRATISFVLGVIVLLAIMSNSGDFGAESSTKYQLGVAKQLNANACNGKSETVDGARRSDLKCLERRTSAILYR